MVFKPCFREAYFLRNSLEVVDEKIELHRKWRIFLSRWRLTHNHLLMFRCDVVEGTNWWRGKQKPQQPYNPHMFCMQLHQRESFRFFLVPFPYINSVHWRSCTQNAQGLNNYEGFCFPPHQSVSSSSFCLGVAPFSPHCDTELQGVCYTARSLFWQDSWGLAKEPLNWWCP